MASAPTPPPLLPVINPATAGSSPATAGGGSGSDAPIATPAFRLFLSRLSESARRSLSDRRPWGELLDRSAFSKPDSLSDATSRLRRNLAYFRVNYAAVVAFALGASLLAHPFSLLILLGLLAAWCFLYLFRASDQPVVLFGRTFSDREALLGLVGASFVLLFFTSVASLIISGLLVGGAAVAAHGAFRVPEDLFLDEPNAAPGNSATQGLLSFLGAPGSGV
ncbi:PRA1 family protein B2-like [Phragmites australis]|uniref:PRA1 family protein B2-like n=1 Tax=Phragmites australis TaxID=29695 RepID=UPI002D77621F|nr:PRA1 family protein B2-like [Phragmites australis]